MQEPSAPHKELTHGVFKSWSGLSGAQYQFWNVAIGDVLPSEGGVYLVSRELSGLAGAIYPDGLEAIYVGKAQSLFERMYSGLENHHKWLAMHTAGAQFVGIHLVATETERTRIETDLIQGLNPRLNEQLNALGGLLGGRIAESHGRGFTFVGAFDT